MTWNLRMFRLFRVEEAPQNVGKTCLELVFLSRVPLRFYLLSDAQDAFKVGQVRPLVQVVLLGDRLSQAFLVPLLNPLHNYMLLALLD